MKKVLLSWISLGMDFEDAFVSQPSSRKRELNPNALFRPEGPSNCLHQQLWDGHEKHLILSLDSREEKQLASRLQRELQRLHPGHPVEIRFLEQRDEFDFNGFKIRMGKILREFDLYDQVDILFSNGTTPMRMAWVLLHLERLQQGHTHLYQGKSSSFTGGSADFLEIEVDISGIALRLGEEIQLSTLAPPSEAHLILPSQQAAYQRARQIARVDLEHFPSLCTLISGPHGVGKESLARAIHQQSVWSQGPFEVINCWGTDDEKLYAQLFGAIRSHGPESPSRQVGWLEKVSKGTIFLDQVEKLSPAIQTSLLAAIDQQQIRPLGAENPQPLSVRIIAACEEPLQQACQEGRFRWDLYERLSLTRLSLPALADFPVAEKKQLIDHFLDKQAPLFKRRPLKLHALAQNQLLNHPFPGNIRELKKLITSLYVFVEHEQVFLEDLLSLMDGLSNSAPPLSLKEVEKQHIQKVMAMFGGKKAPAAQALGMDSKTLSRRLKAYAKQ
jgi:transcriptional regulator with AAA-type ATPase domain